MVLEGAGNMLRAVMKVMKNKFAWPNFHHKTPETFSMGAEPATWAHFYQQHPKAMEKHMCSRRNWAFRWPQEPFLVPLDWKKHLSKHPTPSIWTSLDPQNAPHHSWSSSEVGRQNTRTSPWRRSGQTTQAVIGKRAP